LSKLDYLVVVLILIVSGTVGFLEGVAVGIAAAVLLFVVDYSRVNVVKHTLSGQNRHSTYTRNNQHRQILNREGAQLYILELQGFIFFGTANRLLTQIRERVQERDAGPVRFVLLDFRQVTGLDSSALFSFVKMKQHALANGIALVLTHLSPAVQRQLEQTGLAQTQGDLMRVFPDMDHGIEWCEDCILSAAGDADGLGPRRLQDQLPDAPG
jgi:SulP family sulfate permease